MPKTVRIAVASLLVAVSVMGIVLLALDRAARHEPQFYLQALQAEPEKQEQAGDALEQSVLELHNDARNEGFWEATFSDEQLNGWLASDLPVKFPNLLPPGSKDPRIAIDPESARIACRYERGKINTVVSLALDIQMTEQTNQVAVRVRKVRAGVLPVPLKRFLDRIARAAGRAEIPLSWSQTEGDPVALVTVPVQHEDYAHREIYLETLELRHGEVYLAGRTEAEGNQLLARGTPRPQVGENRTVQR